MKPSATFQYLLCITLANNFFSEAFILAPSRGIVVSNPSPNVSTMLSAGNGKKNRRKRKQPKPDSSSEDLPDFDLDDSVLPEFDLGEEDEPVKPTATRELSFDEISDNMMGNASAPTASIEDLIADRKLESKFVFDDTVVDETIPDFVDFARPSSASQEPLVPGSKAGRREQRKAAAMARLEAEKEASKLDIDISFIKDEKGNISGIKILEAGAWAGIFLLVGWEVYLNSPFFDRAAPMAPVVFENP